MKLTSNARNIFRAEHSEFTFGPAVGGGEKIALRPHPPLAGSQQGAPDTISQTWRSNPSLGLWRPLGDVTETRWTATPIQWTSQAIGPSKGGTALAATVELPEWLSMAGCPAALFFSFSVSLGIGGPKQHSDWNCFINVSSLFNTAQLLNPGFLITETFAQFTGCVYGNLRKQLRDTRIAITVNGFYNDGGELQGTNFVDFNLNGSALTLN